MEGSQNPQKQQPREFDFSMTELEARTAIKKFNRAYRDFEKSEFKESENVEQEESESDSSEGKIPELFAENQALFNLQDDVGIEDQILEIIQKQIENSNYLERYRGDFRRPRIPANSKKTEFQTNVVKTKNVNGMSIMLSKDPPKNTAKYFHSNSNKLEDLFVDLIKDQKYSS